MVCQLVGKGLNVLCFVAGFFFFLFLFKKTETVPFFPLGLIESNDLGAKLYFLVAFISA